MSVSSATGPTGCFTGPLGGLSDQDWDVMAGERFYSTALWLRLCALAPGGTSGGLHAELPGGHRAGVPVAALRDEGNPYARWQDQLTSRGLPSPPAEGVLVGQRRGYLGHLLTTPGADRDEAAALLLSELRKLRMPAQDGHAPAGGDAAPPCVAMYVTTEDVLALRAAGVRTTPVALQTDAWIDLPPGGWEAWQESLGSVNRARNMRREVRLFEEAGYQVEHRTLHEAHAEVARLLAATNERYGLAMDVPALTRSFARQGELAGEHAQVLLCAKEGRPAVGFCLYYHWHDTVFIRAVGFDYEKLSSAAEYFNLAYYLPARLTGARRLHAGISMPEAKALRGATLRPLWLLDLSEQSVLAGRDEEIRSHNRKYVAELQGVSPVVARSLPHDLWDVFC